MPLVVGYAVPAGRLGRVATGTSSRSYRPPVRADLYGRRVWLEITWSSRSEGTTSATSACASGCRRFFGSRGRSSGRQQAGSSKLGRQFEGWCSARAWRTLSVFRQKKRSLHLPARPASSVGPRTTAGTHHFLNQAGIGGHGSPGVPVLRATKASNAHAQGARPGGAAGDTAIATRRFLWRFV